MFVHSPGEELWLLFTDFPRLVETIRLPFKTDQEISLITVLLSELKATQINREHLPCKNYKNELEFNECGKKALWKMIGSFQDLRKLFRQTLIFLNAIHLKKAGIHIT